MQPFTQHGHKNHTAMWTNNEHETYLDTSDEWCSSFACC